VSAFNEIVFRVMFLLFPTRNLMFNFEYCLFVIKGNSFILVLFLAFSWFQVFMLILFRWQYFSLLWHRLSTVCFQVFIWYISNPSPFLVLYYTFFPLVLFILLLSLFFIHLFLFYKSSFGPCLSKKTLYLE
jgi:hypothetical protein